MQGRVLAAGGTGAVVVGALVVLAVVAVAIVLVGRARRARGGGRGAPSAPVAGARPAAVASRVLVAVDDPRYAGPLVELACGLARARPPGEVVLARFEEQDPRADRWAATGLLDDLATDLDALHGLVAQVRAQGLSTQTFSQRTSAPGRDIVAQALRLDVDLVLVGDRRDDPGWVATIEELVAAGPADVGVVVVPRGRPLAPAEERRGPPVVEAGPGPAAVAALEYGVRLALPTGRAPVVVGAGAAGRGARRHRAVAARLTGLGHPTTVLDAPLDAPEGAAAADGAGAIVRPLPAGVGLRPVERSHPVAERHGCPVLLVAPGRRAPAGAGLDALLAAATPVRPTP